LLGDIVEAVISDLHIGNSNSVFSSPDCTRTVNQFTQELKEIGPVEKVILLGDIFDFWDAELFDVIRESSSFFEKISNITKEIIYIPGNHDHHSLILCEEMENIRKLEERTDLHQYPFQDILKYEYPKRKNSGCKEAGFLKGLIPALKDTHIQLFYPEYTCKWKGKEILFRHGHYLDSGLFKLMPWIFEQVGGKIRSEKDFEIVNTPLYEHFYRCGKIREISRFYRKLYNIYKCTEKVYKRKYHRDINSRKRDIQTFFTRFRRGNGYPDVFIFAHTHVAGTGVVQCADTGTPSPVKCFNSGSWTKEAHIQHVNTYITIGDTIDVREVGKGTI
jgi:hypothetical protein